MAKNLIVQMLVPTALLAVSGQVSAGPSQAVSSQDKSALVSALDDEYRAEATYAAVLQKFGEVRPFVNVIEAERRHAARVRSEMNRLGIKHRSTNPYLGKITAPDSLLAACRLGVTAERENIGLYDRLLPNISDPQVRATLVALQSASKDRHLPAFQRCVDRGGTMGPGAGRGHRGAGRN